MTFESLQDSLKYKRQIEDKGLDFATLRTLDPSKNYKYLPVICKYALDGVSNEEYDTKYKVNDYVVLDLDKLNSDGDSSKVYSKKYGKINWIDKKQFNVENGFPYEVEYLDDETDQVSVKDNEILRLMTPEEIIMNKYNI